MSYPLGRARAAQIVARRQRETRAGRSLGLVISERRTGPIIGMIGLGAMDRHDRGAELYYWVTPSERGKGYALEAARAMLAATSGRLRLHRVTAHVHTFNSAPHGSFGSWGSVAKGGSARSDQRVADGRTHGCWVSSTTSSASDQHQPVARAVNLRPGSHREGKDKVP